MPDAGEDLKVDFEAAVEVVVALAREHKRATGRAMSSPVLVGGTALAAHAVREVSDDVDIYVADIDDEVLDRVTRTFVRRFGARFKIDATPSNTLWGAIALTDIENSPVVRNQDGFAIRALSVETLYVVKTAANRDKDQPDIKALAARTTYEDTLARAKALFPLYADRSSFPEHAERLARYMARDHGKHLADVDRDFALPQFTAEKVQEIRNGMEAQFMHVLRLLIRRRLDLIAYSGARPDVLSFDIDATGAPEEVRALARAKASEVSDIAADVLKSKDPQRHASRLTALHRLRSGGSEP